MTNITIQISNESFDAWLDESTAPVTVKKLLDALPIKTTLSSWGEEFYFRIPVKADLENAAEKVSVGDLAYWPQGQAFCIFFGKTPMSKNEIEIIPASAVSLIGRIDRIEKLKDYKEGEPVKIMLE